MESTHMALTRFMTTGALLAMGSLASAQESLTLADATGRALAKNHSIRVEREHVVAADARARGSLGAYDPQLNVAVNARHHRDPVNSLFSGAPIGSPAPSQNSFSSTMTLSQRLKTGAIAS